MRLSVAVMAHPSRAESVADLRSHLDREVSVSWDTYPPSPDPPQRWQVGRRAWQMIDSDADYGMVIQDDILVTRDLVAGIESALDVLGPDGLVSAYTGTGRPDQASVMRALRVADAHGSAWAHMRSLCWGPAIIVPTRMIGPMLDWCDHPGRAKKNYDYKIGVFFRDVVKWRTLYLVPSLVEHKGLPSLVGHDGPHVRVAHNFHGSERSALDIDWTKVPKGGLDHRLQPLR